MRDAELDELRAAVDCRALLERAGWEYDARESTRLAAKYRGGPGQIVIVTHDGRGWFDPLNDARGDAIALAQRLWGGNIGHARKLLRPMVGIAPALPRTGRKKARELPPLDAPAIWAQAAVPEPGSPAWCYLSQGRDLPDDSIRRAVEADGLREGINGTVWAAHRTAGRAVCGWEMRGPDYKGFTRGGDKALFVVCREGAPSHRVAIAESAIDALSLATLEGWPAGTIYVSTGGGFGPRTAEAIHALLPTPKRLVAATDRGTGGELLAQRLERLAADAGCGFGRLRPRAKDWNEQLRGSRDDGALEQESCTVQDYDEVLRRS